MMNSGPRNRHESSESFEIALMPPAVETLLYPERTNSPWPEEIKENVKLREEIFVRRELLAKLDLLFSAVPKADTDIENAVKNEQVDRAALTETYNQLAEFLKREPYSERLTLYFPVELIPSAKWRPNDPALEEAAERFREVYLEKWSTMLNVHDVRGNFVDGDVPEEEVAYGDWPRVSKAAHLIPLLVKKGLISIDEVVSIIDTSQDEVLIKSTVDTLPVLADMGLLSDEVIEEMEDSHSQAASNAAKNLKKILAESSPRNDREIPGAAWLQRMPETISRELEASSAGHERARGKAGDTRIQWLKVKDRKDIVERYADLISREILAGRVRPEDLRSSLESADDAALAAAVYGVGDAIETLHRRSGNAGESLDAFENLLAEIRNKGGAEVAESLDYTWTRLSSLGIVDARKLEELGIQIPKLDADFPMENTELTDEFKAIAASIESDSELSKVLMPAVIVCGSKIKGYGTRTSDNDVAVFIQPGVSFDERPAIQARIKEVLSAHRIKGGAIEFWLEETPDGNLRIQDVPERAIMLGRSTQSDILFGGVYCGKSDTIEDLHKRLLAALLYEKGEKVDGFDKRKVSLEEMERAVLQYRLMHRGYSRFYPEQGGIHTPHSASIDSDSTFWDSGYRRLATKLFLKKVFLPQLSR